MPRSRLTPINLSPSMMHLQSDTTHPTSPTSRPRRHDQLSLIKHMNVISTTLAIYLYTQSMSTKTCFKLWAFYETKKGFLPKFKIKAFTHRMCDKLKTLYCIVLGYDGFTSKITATVTQICNRNNGKKFLWKGFDRIFRRGGKKRPQTPGMKIVSSSCFPGKRKWGLGYMFSDK